MFAIVSHDSKRGRGKRHHKKKWGKYAGGESVRRKEKGDWKMLRKSIDCREHPGDIHCSVTLSADSEDELLEAAMQHLTAVHRYKDTHEVRETLRKGMMDGIPLK